MVRCQDCSLVSGSLESSGTLINKLAEQYLLEIMKIDCSRNSEMQGENEIKVQYCC